MIVVRRATSRTEEGASFAISYPFSSKPITTSAKLTIVLDFSPRGSIAEAFMLAEGNVNAIEGNVYRNSVTSVDQRRAHAKYKFPIDAIFNRTYSGTRDKKRKCKGVS
jgi:hypothetical protein